MLPLMPFAYVSFTTWCRKDELHEGAVRPRPRVGNPWPRCWLFSITLDLPAPVRQQNDRLLADHSLIYQTTQFT